MIKETATADEVREIFVPSDAESATRALVAIMDEELDAKASWKLMEACAEATIEKIEKDAKPYERIMVLIKQAYLFEFYYATSIHYKDAEANYKALFYGDALSQT